MKQNLITQQQNYLQNYCKTAKMRKQYEIVNKFRVTRLLVILIKK